jgi:isoleucyl-tRNA synthetase
VRNPLVPTLDSLPTVVYNEITSSYGTGILPVIPGHDVESLKIASIYPEIPKDGCLDQQGCFKRDEFGIPVKFAGISVKDDKTNAAIISHLDQKGHLFRSFKF